MATLIQLAFSKKNFKWSSIVLILILGLACNSDDDNPDTPTDTYLHIDLNEVPFTNLSDYGFFINGLKKFKSNN